MNVNVVIGRFSGFHEGHRHLIETANSLGDNTIILIGSANRPRTIKNPWTWQERAKKILDAFPGVIVAPLNDYKYNDEQWIADVGTTVNFLISKAGIDSPRITLVGYEKDDTQYLEWFPEWRYYRLEESNTPLVSATLERENLFKTNPSIFTPEVLADWNYFQKERELFKDYPFPETLNFNCADAIVECAGQILLVQRNGVPGMNTWALPGGFRESNETFLQTALRELLEETNLRVPEKVIRGSIVSKKLFDEPDRGCGIPRNTVAFYIKLSRNSDGGLPRANGSSDAKAAKWVTLFDAMNKYKLFDDHQDIISDMLGIKPIPAIFNEWC